MTLDVNGELPLGWIADKLGSIIQPRGERVSPSDYPNAKFIGMDHVESDSTRVIGFVSASKMKSSASRFHQGDVLYGRLRPYLNKVTKPSFDGLASAEFIVFPDSELMKSSYLKYRLNAADFVSFATHLNEGDRPRVSFDQIGKFLILVPPPAEQSRIVAKIDELFSELDKGVESLKIARQQLGIYRRVVLKDAFEGKLTAEWRNKNRGKLGAADQLLSRIRRERELHYQQQVADWNCAVKDWQENGANGKKPSKPRPPKSLTSLSKEVIAGLEHLPPGWIWEKLGWMTCGVEYGTAAKSSEAGLVPVVRMGNLQNGKIDWADLVHSSDKAEIEQYLLQPGDVLFNRTNSPELVGKTAIYRGERPALFAGYLIRVNHIEATVDSQYLNLFLNSHVARQHGNSVKTDGVNQSNINGEKLQNYPFPYCSFLEQHEIVRVLHEKLSLVEQMQQEIETALLQAEALRQSILKAAFSGRLVGQNPTDEPASMLLERIKSENSQQVMNNKNGKRKAAA